MPSLFKIEVRSILIPWCLPGKLRSAPSMALCTIKSQWQKNRAINKAYLQCGRWPVAGGRWSVVGGLTTVIWSVVGCCSGRWLNNRDLVSGRLLFWSVVGFFTAIGRWSVVFQIGGRWFLWSVVGYFLGKWSVVPGRWSVVGVTVVGGLWSVGGGFVLRRYTMHFQCLPDQLTTLW